MNDLTTLVAAIIAKSIVDAGEVTQLRTLMMEDGVIDQEEANALFEINDACSDSDNDPTWSAFFTEAISSHVLEDESTPGVIDEGEGNWLADHIEGDGAIDATEQALLAYLQENATSIESTRLTALINLAVTA